MVRDTGSNFRSVSKQVTALSSVPSRNLVRTLETPCGNSASTLLTRCYQQDLPIPAVFRQLKLRPVARASRVRV